MSARKRTRQPSCGGASQSHTSRRAHFFLRQPCRVRQRLLNVFRLQVRIVGEDFINRRAMGELADDDRDGDAHAANAGAAAEDVRVEGDAIEWHSIIIGSNASGRAALTRRCWRIAILSPGERVKSQSPYFCRRRVLKRRIRCTRSNSSSISPSTWRTGSAGGSARMVALPGGSCLRAMER